MTEEEWIEFHRAKVARLEIEVERLWEQAEYDLCPRTYLKVLVGPLELCYAIDALNRSKDILKEMIGDE